MADQSKTEKATPKRRRDERKKGHIRMSRDVVAVSTLLGSLVMLKVMSSLALEKAGDDRSLEELEAITAGALRRAVQDGDWQKGTFMAGQVSGMVNSRRPCREIVQGMAAEAETLLTALAARFGKGV